MSLTRFIHSLETDFDRLQEALRQRVGYRQSVMIQPYMSFGTAERSFLHGRVLEDRIQQETDSDTSRLHNLFTVYLHANSNEIKEARLRFTQGEQVWYATTNKEGYFALEIEQANQPGWQQFTVELLDAPLLSAEKVAETTTAVVDLFVPHPTAEFGIISDIDDTVLVSEATNLLKAVSLMLLHNAHTRTPFPNVADLYRALQAGRVADSPADLNPLFYVSSSPWNLYEMLTEFFDLHEMPRGPLFLQDYGFTPDQLLIASHASHKKGYISRLLDAYPHLPFVLMGDSGQKDPEIYQQIVADYPGRILAVYIRDVTTEARDTAVDEIAAQVAAHGVPMVRVPDSQTAAQHAFRLGLIRDGKL